MVELVSMTYEEQLAAVLPQERHSRDEILRATERARPVEPPERSSLAFSRSVLAPAGAARRIKRRGKSIVLGHLKFEELESFLPIPAVDVPAKPAYLVADIDLGAKYRNVTPEEALRSILSDGRSPLTLDEGITLMLQQPESIAKNWGYSLPGSRRNDQRVPAFWVSEGRPKLGWCWDRNPHTWLGTASCGARI